MAGFRISQEKLDKTISEIKAYWVGHLTTRKDELLTAMGGTEEQWQVMEAGLERVKWVRFPIQFPVPSIEDLSEIACEAFEA